MTRPSVSCDRVRARLAAEPATPPAPEIAEHLAECDACARWAAGLQGLARVAAQMRVEPDPRDAQVALRLARRARDQVRAQPRFPGWGWPALSASLSTAAAIVIIGLFQVGPSRPASSRTTPQATPAPHRASRTAPSARRGKSSIQSLSSWVLPPRAKTTQALPEDLQQLDRRAALRPSSGAASRR